MFNSSLPADSLDVRTALDADALLAADPDFAAVCDARHEAYLAHAVAHQADPDRACAWCGDAIPDDEGEALTHEQGARHGIDADAALVHLDCLRELARDDEPRDGDLIDCRGCNGTGEGFLGGRCRDCAGQGYRVHREPRDDDRDGTAYAL